MDTPIFDRLYCDWWDDLAARDPARWARDGYEFPFANGHGPGNAAVEYIDKHPEPVQYIDDRRLTESEPHLVPVYQRDLDALSDILSIGRTGYVGKSGTYNVDSYGTIHANLGGDFPEYRARNRARYGDGNDAPEDRYRP